jgi:hypothetical protein
LQRTIPPEAWSNLFGLFFVVFGLGGVVWIVRLNRAVARNDALGHRSWRPKLPSSAAAMGAPIATAVSSNASSMDTGGIDSASRALGSFLGSGASTSSLKTQKLDTGAMWQASQPSAVGGASSGAEVALRPVTTPFGQACGLTCITLFWNGIVSVFLFAIFRERMGAMNVFMGLFLIPFVLIGILLIFATISSFGALFVPRPQLTASNTVVPLGGSVQLRWRQPSGLRNPTALSISLEAREEATYTRGTDTYTDRNVFYKQELWQSTPSGDLSGSTTVSVPAGLIHSFEAPRNKILWAIKVKGQVPLWPDFEDEYRIVVTPLTASASTATL